MRPLFHEVLFTDASLQFLVRLRSQAEEGSLNRFMESKLFPYS